MEKINIRNFTKENEIYDFVDSMGFEFQPFNEKMYDLIFRIKRWIKF
jgi:hypothetical protein